MFRYIFSQKLKEYLMQKTHQAKVFSLSTLLCLAVLKVLAVEADIASPEMDEIGIQISKEIQFQQISKEWQTFWWGFWTSWPPQ